MSSPTSDATAAIDAPGPDTNGRPLRIAFVSPEDRHTGTFFRSHNFARALAQIGHEVTVLSQSYEQRIRESSAVRDGIRYVFAPTVPGNRLVIGPTNPGNVVRRLLRRVHEFDVFHLFQPFPSGAIPWLALRWRRGQRAVFAYDWDDYWVSDELGLKNPRGLNARWTALWVHYFQRRLPRHAQMLTTLSHRIADLAREWGSPRVHLVYNGIWPETLIERRTARAELQLRPDALYVAMMGWTGEMEWALDAVRACAAELPALRIAWCGKDPTAVLEHYSDLRERVDYLGVLSGRPLLAFRCAVDLGLIPMADTEFNRFRLPYKLTDFLSAGVPVLANDIGETAVFAAKMAGIVTCPPDRESWLRTFAQTVRGLAAGTPIPTPNPAWLLERLSWTTHAHHLVRAYREVQAAHARQPAPAAA